MVRNENEHSVGDSVSVPWGLDYAEGVVQEIYGPDARRSAVVKLTGALGDDDVTVTMPLSSLVPIAEGRDPSPAESQLSEVAIQELSNLAEEVSQLNTALSRARGSMTKVLREGDDDRAAEVAGDFLGNLQPAAKTIPTEIATVDPLIERLLEHRWSELADDSLSPMLLEALRSLSIESTRASREIKRLAALGSQLSAEHEREDWEQVGERLAKAFKTSARWSRVADSMNK